MTGFNARRLSQFFSHRKTRHSNGNADLIFNFHPHLQHISPLSREIWCITFIDPS